METDSHATKRELLLVVRLHNRRGYKYQPISHATGQR